MKRQLILLCILILSSNFITANEVLSYLGGKLVFQRPADITLWEERPSFNNVREQSSYWHGKIRLVVDIYNTAALKGAPPTLMAETVYETMRNRGYLLRADLLGLFDMKNDFVLWDYKPQTNIRGSYQFLVSDGEKIGETYFHADSLGMRASVIYGYTTSVIVGDNIVNIYLTLTNDDINKTDNMKAYFVPRGNNLYWKNTSAINKFYEDFSSSQNTGFHEQLQMLRDAYNMLVGTMEIRQQDNGGKNIETIKPAINYQKTHVTTANLNLRDEERTLAPVRLTIPQGSDVQVLRTGLTVTIDNITAPWVVVTTANGDTGWCFSGYLEETPY